MQRESRPPGSGRAGFDEPGVAGPGYAAPPGLRGAGWRAVGWNAALGIRAGLPVISLAFRGGGELHAERRDGRWVVIGGSDDGLALVDDLVEAGVLTRGPERPDAEPEHRLASAVVESALGT